MKKVNVFLSRCDNAIQEFYCTRLNNELSSSIYKQNSKNRHGCIKSSSSWFDENG